GKVLGEASVQVDITGERLFSEGQLGKADIELATKLVEAEATLQSLKARDESLAKTEQQLRAEINRFPSMIAQYNRLQPEVEIKRKTLEQLLENRQDLGLELARGGFNWQVVEEPRLGEKIGPSLKRNLMLGAVVGLFLGGVAAFVRESLDDAVHTSDDLKKGVALPLLGIIPELPQPDVTALSVNFPFRKLSVTTPSILQTIQWLPFRESLDLIYKNIQLLSPTSKLQSLMVTSALPGEGKSTLVLGLALSAARLHQRVLLIDADLRRPTLHKQLNLSNDQGLSTLLENDTTIPSPLRLSLADSDIDILTAGPTPTDPVKLLSSRRMQELMAIFEQSYDLVLLDTPPILGMVDAIQVASFCSGVVIVGRIDRTTQSELTEATAMLSKLNAIGIVANGASGSMKGYLTPAERNGHSSSRVYQPLVGGQGSHEN
ncbi:MAG: polysaccharide biosynthesis tyrosine autokinase, partial [Coleofasciculus sp. S288]|nr:polysaccharide biosynthesis tyrosine autokinase [Coleofasciculus sp. S288]